MSKHTMSKAAALRILEQVEGVIAKEGCGHMWRTIAQAMVDEGFERRYLHFHAVGMMRTWNEVGSNYMTQVIDDLLWIVRERDERLDRIATGFNELVDLHRETYPGDLPVSNEVI